MRTVFASIAFVLSLSLGTSAQDSNAQITAAVRDVLVRQQDAWNRHDLEAFYVRLLEFARPDVLLGSECDYWLARYP